jgi:modulator of FtsH protease
MHDQVILPPAYAAAHWTDFGVAVAGASATLAGLVFVAVSINLRQILKSPNLPGRAGQTLTLFATPLLIGVLLVVPAQPRTVLAWELIVTGAITGGFQLWVSYGSKRSDQESPLTWLVSRIGPAVASYGCLLVAGATLLAQAGGGLFWLVPSVLTAIIFGLVNAWVLLVEILR